MILKRILNTHSGAPLPGIPVSQFRWSVLSAWLLVFTISIVAWGRLLDIVRAA